MDVIELENTKKTNRTCWPDMHYQFAKHLLPIKSMGYTWIAYIIIRMKREPLKNLREHKKRVDRRQ